MTDKVVVCFRYHDASAETAQYLGVAEAILRRAIDAGGTLVLWSGAAYGFAFDPSNCRRATEMVAKALCTVPCHAVALARGELKGFEGEDGAVASWGHAIAWAEELARVAEPGQALIHPSVGQSERLQKTRDLTVEMAGVSETVGELDLESPWRPGPRRTAADLGPAPLIGRPDLGELLVRAGTLAVVRAPTGVGGTRFLSGLEQHLHGSPVLRVGPHPVGEPLGALSRAIRRARELTVWSVELDVSLKDAVESLLASEGLDLDTCAELVAAWMKPRGPRDASGSILIDDASWVDADSLDAIRQALDSTGDPFRVVLQVEPDQAIPLPFQSLPLEAEVRLGHLTPEQAATMVRQLLLAECDAQMVADWVRRASGEPLALREAILEGLEQGELEWTENGVTGALEASSLTAEHTIARRLWRLAPHQRALIKALSVFGGEATLQELSSLLEGGEEDVPTRELLGGLAQAQWVEPLGCDLWALPSRTHCRAVVETLSENELRLWHSKAAEVLVQSERPMAAAQAAVHAALAEDAELCFDLANRATEVARAAGLEDTTRALEAFAQTGKLSGLEQRGLLPEFAEWTRSGSVVPSYDPKKAASGGGGPKQEAPQETEGRQGIIEDSEPPTTRRKLPNTNSTPPGSTRQSERSPSGAAQALRAGDVGAMEQLISQLRTEKHDASLIERLEGLMHLAKGESAEALRQLGNAAAAAKTSETHHNQCKAALAHGVALAKVGRREEALLEVLEGLARARETGDGPGERACLRFLTHLCESVGQEEAASLWREATRAEA